MTPRELEEILVFVWIRKISGFLLAAASVAFAGFMVYAVAAAVLEFFEEAFFFRFLWFLAIPSMVLERSLPVLIAYGAALVVLLPAYLLCRRRTKGAGW